MTREWDAAAYHRLSSPQYGWGLRVLRRLPLRGDETVLDVGCGSGRLTAELLGRLPRGRVIALDASENMLAEARATLAPFGDRVTFVRADAGDLQLDAVADAVFSTATFHWVLDHRRLFAGLARAIRAGVRGAGGGSAASAASGAAPGVTPDPFGGWLVAQCGGGANIARLRARADAVLAEPDLAACLAGRPPPWHYADAETTRVLLAEAGFTDAKVTLTEAPVVLDGQGTYREFLGRVVFGAQMEALGDDGRRARFLDAMVAGGAADDPPWSLDYVRLDITARKIR